MGCELCDGFFCVRLRRWGGLTNCSGEDDEPGPMVLNKFAHGVEEEEEEEEVLKN